MSNRITIKNLEYLVDRINEVTGQPATSWTKTKTGITANIGNYHLAGAYGLHALEQMYNDGGGVMQIFPLSTKRELYDKMRAFLAGYEQAKKDKK